MKRLTPSEQKKQDDLLVRLIYKDYQPFSIVDDEGFVAYSKGLNPNYELPSRPVLTEKLLYEKYNLVSTV